jgi:hypothetical protein
MSYTAQFHCLYPVLLDVSLYLFSWMSQFVSYSAGCHSLYLILLDVTVYTLFCWMSQSITDSARCRSFYLILLNVTVYTLFCWMSQFLPYSAGCHSFYTILLDVALYILFYRVSFCWMVTLVRTLKYKYHFDACQPAKCCGTVAATPLQQKKRRKWIWKGTKKSWENVLNKEN